MSRPLVGIAVIELSRALAEPHAADTLVIATDVGHAILGFGTRDARPIGRVTAPGHFASGSMGPEVETALHFVRSGGPRSIITTLGRIAVAVDGAGTIIERHAAPVESDR